MDRTSINNAQGTPVLITDEQNNPVSKINLDEWGNVGDKTTGPRQEINYTGKKLDIPTRLYYFNQRYYDPEIGRFVNEDPAGQGMNHYAYCGNNPLMYTDPDGEFFFLLAPLMSAMINGAIQGAIYGAIIGGSVGGVNAAIHGGNFFQGMYQGATQGAMAGALTGGIAGGINYMAGGAINSISGGLGNALGMGNQTASTLLTDGVRNGLYTVGEGVVTGQHMSLENTWGVFSGGFGNGVLQSASEMLYQNVVGFSPDPASGKGVAGDGAVRERKPGEAFVGQAENSIGVPVTPKQTDLLNGFLQAVFPEGGFVSTVLNLIPGQNAHSKLHDTWGSNPILAFLSPPITGYITYQGLTNRMRKAR